MYVYDGKTIRDLVPGDVVIREDFRSCGGRLALVMMVSDSVVVVEGHRFRRPDSNFSRCLDRDDDVLDLSTIHVADGAHLKRLFQARSQYHAQIHLWAIVGKNCWCDNWGRMHELMYDGCENGSPASDPASLCGIDALFDESHMYQPPMNGNYEQMFCAQLWSYMTPRCQSPEAKVAGNELENGGVNV